MGFFCLLNILEYLDDPQKLVRKEEFKKPPGGRTLRVPSGVGGFSCAARPLGAAALGGCAAQLLSGKAAGAGCERGATPLGIRDCHVGRPCDITAPCFRDSSGFPGPGVQRFSMRASRGAGRQRLGLRHDAHNPRLPVASSHPAGASEQTRGPQAPHQFPGSTARPSGWTPASADWLEGAAT